MIGSAEQARIARLREMYRKYEQAGLKTAAQRTLARLHELGATLEEDR